MRQSSFLAGCAIALAITFASSCGQNKGVERQATKSIQVFGDVSNEEANAVLGAFEAGKDNNEEGLNLFGAGLGSIAGTFDAAIPYPSLKGLWFVRVARPRITGITLASVSYPYSWATVCTSISPFCAAPTAVSVNIFDNPLQYIGRDISLVSGAVTAYPQFPFFGYTQKISFVTVSVPVVVPVGAWLQADRQDCGQVCATRGLLNSVSPEGARCASGETVPASSLGSISYRYGCWPNCSGRSSSSASSRGGFCYNSGQKRDNDRTDRTVGCFCANAVSTFGY